MINKQIIHNTYIIDILCINTMQCSDAPKRCLLNGILAVPQALVIRSREIERYTEDLFSFVDGSKSSLGHISWLWTNYELKFCGGQDARRILASTKFQDRSIIDYSDTTRASFNHDHTRKGCPRSTRGIHRGEKRHDWACVVPTEQAKCDIGVN